MTTIVLVSEQTLSPHDVERLTTLHEDQVSVVLLIPSGDDRSELDEAIDDLWLGKLREIGSDDEGLTPDSAAAAVQASVLALTAAGATARGAVAPADPVEAALAAADEVAADEIWVLTEPHVVRETFHRDWASRLRKAGRYPVLHAISGTDRVVS